MLANSRAGRNVVCEHAPKVEFDHLFGRRRIRIGQPIVVKIEDYLSHDEVPTEFTITSAKIEEWHITRARTGYKFLILQIRAKNMGRREVTVSFLPPVGSWEVRVDNGYVYRASGPVFSLRPGEVGEQDMPFEILASTRPVECYTASEFGEQYVFDLRTLPSLAPVGLCSRCGKHSPPDSNYCTECGTKLSG